MELGRKFERKTRNSSADRVRRGGKWREHQGLERQKERKAAGKERSKEAANKTEQVRAQISERNEKIVHLKSLGIKEGSKVTVRIKESIVFGTVKSFDEQTGMVWVQLETSINQGYEKDIRLCLPFDIEPVAREE